MFRTPRSGTGVRAEPDQRPYSSAGSARELAPRVGGLLARERQHGREVTLRSHCNWERGEERLKGCGTQETLAPGESRVKEKETLTGETSRALRRHHGWRLCWSWRDVHMTVRHQKVEPCSGRKTFVSAWRPATGRG